MFLSSGISALFWWVRKEDYSEEDSVHLGKILRMKTESEHFVTFAVLILLETSCQYTLRRTSTST